MRELLLGPKRFSDLRETLPGISANLLTQRLQHLESVAIVQRKRLPPPAASSVYELTEWGAESEEMIKVIGRWAARSPTMADGKPMSVNSVILSLRTMFSPDAAGNLNAVIGLRFGDDEFLARLADGVLEITRGEADLGDAVISGDQNAFVGAVYGEVPLDELENAGDIALAGKRALIKRFCKLFPLPEQAPALGAGDVQ